MKSLLNDLAPRERLLLSIAGILTISVIFVLAVVRPVLAAHSDAGMRYENSARALDVVAGGVWKLPSEAGGTLARPALNTDELRRRVTQVAQETGLALTQLRSEEDGSVAVVFRDVDSRLVFAFLQVLSSREEVNPTVANINRTEEGRVSASFEFEGLAQ